MNTIQRWDKLCFLENVSECHLLMSYNKKLSTYNESYLITLSRMYYEIDRWFSYFDFYKNVHIVVTYISSRKLNQPPTPVHGGWRVWVRQREQTKR